MEELDATVDIVMEGGRQGRRNRVRHESRLTGWRKGRLGGRIEIGLKPKGGRQEGQKRES